MSDKKIRVMMAGLPGDMATQAAKKINAAPDMGLALAALTGAEIAQQHVKIDSSELGGPTSYIIPLFKPEHHRVAIRQEMPSIIVDYTQPDAVNRNAELYAEYNIPTVIGTTGGDRAKLVEIFKNSQTCAVIAPNMSVPLVALTAGLEYLAKDHAGCLSGFTGEIEEEHQLFKKDPSGTMLSSWKPALEKIGVNLKELRSKRRSPKGRGYHYVDLTAADHEKFSGVPVEFLFEQLPHMLAQNFPGALKGFGAEIKYAEPNYHIAKDVCSVMGDLEVSPITLSPMLLTASKGYEILNVGLTSEGGDVRLKLYYNAKKDIGVRAGFSTEVDGRTTYADGTVRAIRFLGAAAKSGAKGRVFSMVDVLHGL